MLAAGELPMFFARLSQTGQTSRVACSTLCGGHVSVRVGTMLDSEVVALVDELESLGAKLTVLPRLDGSLRLNCWRFQNAWNNRERINRLLAERIDSSPENAAQIAAFIEQRTASVASAG
jgi:hypothetical protein